MNIFIHLEVESSQQGFQKLEWILYENGEQINHGEISKDSPCYLLEFVQFLLAVGGAKNIIGHHLKFKLKAIGIAMDYYHLQMKLERPDKINHIDLENLVPGMIKPQTVNEVYEAYKKMVINE